MPIDKDQMHPISVEELLRYECIPIDVYLLVDDRYLLICKAGIQRAQLNKLTARGISTVAIRLRDHAQLVHQSIKAGISEGAEDKLAGLHDAMEKVYSEIELMGFDVEAFDHVKQVNHVTLSFLSRNPRLMGILSKIEDLQANEAKHLMTVSMFTALLGIGHGWSKPGTIEKLALIGYLHDIGKIKIPKDICNKPIGQMSRNELTIYQSHGEAGCQILSQSKTVPDDILLAVHEHHELADGSGYPKGLKDVYISPLARVVSLADFIVEELEALEGVENKEKLIAVADRVMARPRLFNKDAIAAFQKIVPAHPAKAAG